MGKNKNRGWLGLVAAGVLALGLASCGGDDGATGPQGPAGPAGPAGPKGDPGPAGGAGVANIQSNTSPATTASAAAWSALAPTVTVTGVTIASPPVVSFKVTDSAGLPVVGLGNTTKTSANKYASYPNLAFSLAKLVPGTNGSPSKWVSYIVTGNETAAGVVSPSTPTTDSNGTLVDNKDGTYSYTFRRDVTTMKATMDGLTAATGANKADLGDLTWEPSLTHRLTVVVSGNAPGTGTNTSDGSASPVLAVPMKAPFDAVYDFIPATGKPVTATDTSRVIVSNTKCEACHRKLGGIPGSSADASAAAFHGGSRNNVMYCVVCHTDQRKYGRTEATKDATNTFTSSSTYVVDGRTVGNLPNMIHKVHLGPLLANKGYNYGGVLFNETTYPQDNRNCTSCHDGTPGATNSTPQGDNWKSNPSRLACGACHDGINWATGTGVTLADAAAGLTVSPGIAHPAGPLPDDSMCSTCHKSNGSFPAADINIAHTPVTPPNQKNFLVTGASADNNTNAAWIASGGSVNRLPAGAIKVEYEINANSVKRVNISAGFGNPQMQFRMKQNGVVTPLNVFASAAVNPVTGQKEIWNNFAGSPSLYFVFAVPQDGVNTPAEFNATANVYLRCLWNGTAGAAECGTGTSGSTLGLPATPTGTLTGPDANGWYTATLTGSKIPDSASMLTGGIGYSYALRTTQPLTQTNLTDYPAKASTVAVGVAPYSDATKLIPGMPNITGGLIVIAPNVQRVATAGCATALANAEQCVLSGTSAGAYIARRGIVEDARCNACHQELGTFTEEAFHAGQRNDGTTCSWCHRPNQTSAGWSADSTSFVHAIHAGAKRNAYQKYTWHAASATEGFWDITYPGVLNQCETCHLPNTYDYSASASASIVDNRLYRTVASSFSGTAPPAYTLSPYVAPDTSTWATLYGSGFSFNQLTGASTAAAGTTLVTSPTVTVCLACHVSPEAQAHFKVNQGTVYGQRTAALANPETCLVCHGQGRIADISVMHAK